MGKYPDKFKTETETMPRANNALADLYQKSSILSRVFSVTVDESNSNVISNENNFDDLKEIYKGL